MTFLEYSYMQVAKYSFVELLPMKSRFRMDFQKHDNILACGIYLIMANGVERVAVCLHTTKHSIHFSDIQAQHETSSV